MDVGGNARERGKYDGRMDVLTKDRYYDVQLFNLARVGVIVASRRFSPAGND